MERSWRGTRACIILAAVITCFLLASNGRSQCWSPNFSPGMTYKSTGDLNLDRKFNVEGNLIYHVFGVNPNMVVFDDGNSPNAFASPQITLAGFTGTVYFGLGLLRKQLWSMDKGEAAVAGIMAHEFSHIVQMQMGSHLSGKYRELHADFMAGYYLRSKSYVTQTEIEPFAESLFETGDYNFRSPAHHGTPEERVSAMKAGFNTTSALTQAFQSGERFVRSGELGDDASTHSEPDLRTTDKATRSPTDSGDFAQVLNSLVQTSLGGGMTDGPSTRFKKKSEQFKKGNAGPTVTVEVFGAASQPYQLQIKIDPPDTD